MSTANKPGAEMYIDCGLIGDTRGGRVASTHASPPSAPHCTAAGSCGTHSWSSRTVPWVFMTVARFSNLSFAPGGNSCVRGLRHTVCYSRIKACVSIAGRCKNLQSEGCGANIYTEFPSDNQTVAELSVLPTTSIRLSINFFPSALLFHCRD